MTRQLALFDLDNTLLAGDSDHAWGEFLIRKGLADRASHSAQNDAFYRDYERGCLDIHAYVAFTLAPLESLDRQQREALHAEFMTQVVSPMMLAPARRLIEQHQQQGDFCIIITATNEFVTTPIAAAFRVDALLATELEQRAGLFTGKIAGIPCYQQGKVTKLEQWLKSGNNGLSLEHSVFYSDSINDLPLLERVTRPVAVDPDEQLLNTAKARGWSVISLRE